MPGDANKHGEGPIVVIGGADDEHVSEVAARLQAMGHDPVVVDPRAFPTQLRFSLGSSAADIEYKGRAFPTPRAVYLRSLHADPVGFGVNVDRAMATDWRRTSMMLRERANFLSAVLLRWSTIGTRIYNSIECQHAMIKPHQLSLLNAAGLPVPATLWSNDPDRVRAFCKAHPSVYKPVTGGSATRRVQEADLSTERLAKLAASPVCFQELLPGRDVRVYIVDDRVICSMVIRTQALDFRGAEEGVEPIELPTHVQRQCRAAARCLGLRFTGMDLKEDGRGQLKILELNSSPMFLGFERLAGVSIRGPLCDALVGGSHPEPLS